MQPWPEFKSWHDVIAWHIHNHPGFYVQDLYKLIYQGVLGAEHLLADVEQARSRFETEWHTQPATTREPLIEPVAVDGTVVRLHLRPCKGMGWRMEKIWQSFYLSAQKTSAAHEEFVATWSEIIKNPLIPLDRHRIERFDRQMLADGYPPCHHSRQYNDYNRPSYRVVLRRYAGFLFDGKNRQ